MSTARSLEEGTCAINVVLGDSRQGVCDYCCMYWDHQSVIHGRFENLKFLNLMTVADVIGRPGIFARSLERSFKKIGQSINCGHLFSLSIKYSVTQYCTTKFAFFPRLRLPVISTLLLVWFRSSPPSPLPPCRLPPFSIRIAVVQVVRGDPEGRIVLRVSGGSSCVCTRSTSSKQAQKLDAHNPRTCHGDEGRQPRTISLYTRCRTPWTRGAPGDRHPIPEPGIKDAAMQSTR